MTASTTEEKKFALADLGAYADFLRNGPGEKISKQFVGEALGLTSMEISLTAFPPGVSLPFFHSHKQNEELYIIVKGTGQMQLDDQLIDVKEGSMISIKPQVSRCLKAADDSELVYICIQARENSLNQATKQDGQREKTEPLFK